MVNKGAYIFCYKTNKTRHCVAWNTH